MLSNIAMAINDLVGSSSSWEWIDRLQPLGVSQVELWVPWHVTRDTVVTMRRRLDQAGINVVCISSPGYLHGDEQSQGARLIQESINVAEELRAPLVNTYFGHGGDGSDEHAIVRYADSIAPLIKQAEQAGVTVVLENEFDGFGHDPQHFDISRRAESIKNLVTLIQSPYFKLNFDAANFRCASQNVLQAALLLSPHVAYVHVKDVIEIAHNLQPDERWKVFRDGEHRFQTVRLGQGEIPWADILSILAETLYQGIYTFEPHCQQAFVLEEFIAASNYLQHLQRSNA
jgi:sugar phosphate isomerase/epimerase